MTPPVAPFEIPPIITYAVPGFVLLIIIEMIVVKFVKKGRYEYRDSASSLALGFGNRVFGIAVGGLMVLAYFGVYQFRLYNLTTALRQTWTGTLGLNFIFWLPLLYIGFPPLMVLMFSSISLVYQFWIHTELIDRMGPFEWIFNTPSHHRVHHATNAQYLDANYAGVLIIWDRMFGTFVPEDAKEKPHYGIVSQLGTFNPFRIAFHEWAGIWRDVTHAKSIKDVFGYVFGPPGWSPDGSRKTSASIKAEWARRQQDASQATAVAAE
ncbi:MAG: sterol desaturase family protein [Terricaulis sp.]